MLPVIVTERCFRYVRYFFVVEETVHVVCMYFVVSVLLYLIPIYYQITLTVFINSFNGGGVREWCNQKIISHSIKLIKTRLVSLFVTHPSQNKLETRVGWYRKISSQYRKCFCTYSYHIPWLGGILRPWVRHLILCWSDLLNWNI